jgi:hypothetical protein
VFIRCIAVSAVAIGATCFPSAAADKAAAPEPEACAALTGRDKEVLEHLPRESIEDVHKLMEAPFPIPFRTERVSDTEPTVLRGVTIIVRPVQGLTVERLQRLVQCGLMRSAAADPTQPTDWPRTPPGTTPYVYSGGDKFIVDLRSRDPAAADTMWRTAQQLKPSKTN